MKHGPAVNECECDSECEWLAVERLNQSCNVFAWSLAGEQPLFPGLYFCFHASMWRTNFLPVQLDRQNIIFVFSSIPNKVVDFGSFTWQSAVWFSFQFVIGHCESWIYLGLFKIFYLLLKWENLDWEFFFFLSLSIKTNLNTSSF